MGVEVIPGFFQSKDQVLEDIRSNDTWPTTFVSDPSEGLPVHWHSEEVHAYIMEGETDFLDVESQQRLPAKKGDKIIIPARTLHAEGVVRERVVYILAMPVALGADDFLVMRSEEDL